MAERVINSSVRSENTLPGHSPHSGSGHSAPDGASLPRFPFWGVEEAINPAQFARFSREHPPSTDFSPRKA